MLVTIAAQPDSDGDVITLGTATTDSNGKWTFTMPATLPSALADRAAANDGVLNVEALSLAKVANTNVLMQAGLTIPVGVATGSSTTDAAREARGAPLLRAAFAVASQSTLADAPAPPSDTETANSTAAKRAAADDPSPVSTSDTQGTTQPTTTTSDSYSPYKAGGVDYSSATIAPIGDAQGAGCQRPGYIVSSIKRAIVYTFVGEAHAYYDTKASFRYGTTAGTDLSAGISRDFGKHFSISGSVKVGNSMGVNTGYSNRGPYFAMQWKVPIRYHYWREVAWCGTYRVVTDHITPERYQIPPGGATGLYGADVSRWDGNSRWYYAPYKAYVTRDSFAEWTRGKSSEVTWAANVWGFGPSMTTSYSSTRAQRIDAGSGYYRHDIFAYSRSFGDKNGPGIVYSY